MRYEGGRPRKRSGGEGRKKRATVTDTDRDGVGWGLGVGGACETRRSHLRTVESGKSSNTETHSATYTRQHQQKATHRAAVHDGI